MGIQVQTRKIMQKAVDKHELFKRGNLWAERYITGDYIPTGQLPSFLTSQLYGLNLDYDVYVVFSFKTPIGWQPIGQNNAKWFIPEVKYSKTTNHHQSLLRVMTDNPGFYSQF